MDGDVCHRCPAALALFEQRKHGRLALSLSRGLNTSAAVGDSGTSSLDSPLQRCTPALRLETDWEQATHQSAQLGIRDPWCAKPLLADGRVQWVQVTCH